MTWICAFQERHPNSNIEYTEQLHRAVAQSSADAIRPYVVKVLNTTKLVSAILHTDSSFAAANLCCHGLFCHYWTSLLLSLCLQQLNRFGTVLV